MFGVTNGAIKGISFYELLIYSIQYVGAAQIDDYTFIT